MFDVNDLKKKVEEKGEELKEKSAEHLENLKEKSAEHIDNLKKTIEENQDDWKEKSAEHLENLKENVSSNWREIFFGSWKRILAVGLCLIGLWSFLTPKELTPEDYREAEMYFRRGVSYTDIGGNFDMDKALENLDKALKINPNHEKAHIERGMIYAVRHKPSDAIADFTRAIEINPRSAEAYLHRGNSYLDEEEYDLAIEDYGVAIDLNPNYAAAYYNRGNAFREIGKDKLAANNYIMAIELGNDSLVIGSARKELNKLQNRQNR